MQGNPQESSSSQHLSILTNKSPLRSNNVFQMLVFEWLLFGYYLYLFCSVVPSGHYQSRVLLYCLFFLLFDKLDLSYRYCQLQDPLHLSPIINCLRYLSYLCILNLSVLLIRIVIDNQNLHAFIVAMHFMLIMGLFLNQFSKRGMKLDINVDSNNIFSKFVTPVSLFIFNRTCELTHSDFWYLQLILFGINLFISSQLNRILLMKECQYFGWIVLDQLSKQKTVWKKRRALRSMIVVCCVMIVSQNLLLIFQKIKYEISVTIIHSFLVSVVAYMLYVGYLPLRK